MTRLRAGCAGVEVAAIAAVTAGEVDLRRRVVVSWWREGRFRFVAYRSPVVPSAIDRGENRWKTLKPVDIHRRCR